MKAEFKTGFAVGLGVLAAVLVAGLALNWLGPMVTGQGGTY